jgi:4-hydroxy-tetrahydrodipicolinate reductase
VSVHRVQDAGTRRIPLQRKVGVGLTIEEFDDRVRADSLGHVGLQQSVAMIAAAFGWKLTDIREEIGPVVADRPTPSGLGEIEPGRVKGIHQLATGWIDGHEMISLTLDMAVGLEEPRDEVHLSGDPEISTVIPGGLHGDVATAAVVVNALPIVVGARPGLRVMTEVAPPHPYGAFAG